MGFYKFIKALVSIIFRMVFRIKIEGKENLPKDGKVILCSNHINILDPVMLAIAVPRPIVFMAKKEVFENKILNKIFTKMGAFPVDREGSDLSAIRNSLKTLKEDKILGIFPEGTRVKEINLDSVKPGIGLIAIKGKAPVIPIYIDSKYNIFGKVNIIIGKPIGLDEYYGQKLGNEDYKDISKDIMQSIYLLKNI